MKRALVMLLLLLSMPVAAATLKIDGEVYAQRTASLMPPLVQDLWQFNITQLAPDGAPVRKGDVVLGFDTSQLMTQLLEKQSLLKEKQRQLEKLRLELAERQRTEALATAEARAGRDKAERKTQQPVELIAGLEYKKLLIARAAAERKATLMAQREVLAAEQRRQEQRLLGAELAQLQAQVDLGQASLAAMNVTAPRSGLMMHKSNWQGDKFDVGSQIWRGQSAAEIPDMATLAVRAELPERDLQRVAVGMPVRVVIEGGAGAALTGRIVEIGRAIRSKSALQPIPVLDLQIRIDSTRMQLKPGQAIRVELNVADAGKQRG